MDPRSDDDKSQISGMWVRESTKTPGFKYFLSTNLRMEDMKLLLDRIDRSIMEKTGIIFMLFPNKRKRPGEKYPDAYLNVYIGRKPGRQEYKNPLESESEETEEAEGKDGTPF